MCGNKVDKNKKGEDNMVVTSLEIIERRVKKNASNNEKIINNFQKRLEKRGLKKGRVRPRSIVEQQILDSFECK